MGTTEQRPDAPGDGPDGTRWLRMAMWAVGVLLVCVSYFAFGPELAEDRDPEAPDAEPGQVADGDFVERAGFELLHASWGPVDGEVAAAMPAPPPSHQTEWQKREEAFQQMARERWKGTEIFVRKRER